VNAVLNRENIPGSLVRTGYRDAPQEGLCNEKRPARKSQPHKHDTDRRTGQIFYLAIPLREIMNQAAATTLVHDFMQDFAKETGLDPVSSHPKRYLWTDAFAVCNYLGLFQRTHDELYRDLALRLVDQVHHILGRHRSDDSRTGWISGLSPDEGERHPTIGGLRIGKTFPERAVTEPYNEQREWDRDGQYYHYLTKWMHALNRVSRVSGDPVCLTRAIELARAAHAGFTHEAPAAKRMYWKMSIDLTRPLISSMGQHDPLDGLVTCLDLQLSATRVFGPSAHPSLVQEIADLTEICRGMNMYTDDPLGIGGLLSDAAGITRLRLEGVPVYDGLLENVLRSSAAGLDSFTHSGSLELPARSRLAFRELGLSIGLAGIEKLPEWVGKNPKAFNPALLQQASALREYVPLREKIERFWLDKKNRETPTWSDHRDINRVMLATSISPEGFLMNLTVPGLLQENPQNNAE
jgi:hypothetical protein